MYAAKNRRLRITPRKTGGCVSLGEGGATMLVFFATWCPHCQDEVPIISELEGEYGDLRVIMAGIDGEDDPAKVQRVCGGLRHRGTGDL